MRAQTLAAAVILCGCGGSVTSPSEPERVRTFETDASVSTPLTATWTGDAGLDATLDTAADDASPQEDVALGAGRVDSHGPTDSGAPLSPCPATVPDAGQSCTSPDGSFLECEYGGDTHGLCRTLARCTGQWTISQELCATDPSACPSAYGQGEGASCPVGGLCDYLEGRCTCVHCILGDDGGIQSGYWHCRQWLDAGPNCPARSPLAGSVCSAPEGTTCGSDCCGAPVLSVGLQCSAGIWSPSGCVVDCIDAPSVGCY